MPIPLKAPTSKTSANTYASVFGGMVRTGAAAKKWVIRVKENDVNSVTYKILGSIDGTNTETLGDGDGSGSTGEYALDDATAYHTLTDAWPYIDVQVKSTVGGSHGSITAEISETS